MSPVYPMSSPATKWADPVDVGEPGSGGSHCDVETAPGLLQLLLESAYFGEVLVGDRFRSVSTMVLGRIRRNSRDAF